MKQYLWSALFAVLVYPTTWPLFNGIAISALPIRPWVLLLGVFIGTMCGYPVYKWVDRKFSSSDMHFFAWTCGAWVAGLFCFAQVYGLVVLLTHFSIPTIDQCFKLIAPGFLAALTGYILVYFAIDSRQDMTSSKRAEL